MAENPNRVLASQIVWMLTHDTDFLWDFRERIKPDYFGNVGERWLVDKALKHFETYQEALSEIALDHLLLDADDSGELDQLQIEQDDIWTLWDTMASVKKKDFDYMWSKAEEFNKRQGVGLALRQAATMLKDEGPDAAMTVLQEAREITRASETKGILITGDNLTAVMAQIGISEENRDFIETGLPKLDMLMDGGLRTAEVACFASGSGFGKTMFLCHQASIALNMGHEVAYYTLEVEAEEISLRALAGATSSPINDLRRLATARGDTMRAMRLNQKSVLYRLQDLQLRMKRMGLSATKLHVRDLTTRTPTLNHVVGDLQMLRREGHNPKLVIIDYADRLRPSRAFDRKWEGGEEIFQELQAWAKADNIAIWTASQIGRGGISRSALTLDTIQGAFSKVFECTYVIASGQNTEDQLKQSEEFKFLIAKARRSGSRGKHFVVKYDLSRARFYSTEVDLGDNNDLLEDYGSPHSFNRENGDDDPEEEEDARPRRRRSAAHGPRGRENY